MIYLLQETCLSDVPVRMTMKEEIPSGKLFVAYKNGAIDMIDEITVETKRFLTPEPKSHMTSLALTSDGKELVVGYNGKASQPLMRCVVTVYSETLIIHTINHSAGCLNI